MSSYLKRAGLDVRTAHSGSAALQILTRAVPHVAVLDYQLPDRNGAELARQLRQAIPNLPIIMMSGAIGSVEQASLEEIGVKVFVNKPVSLRALLRACTTLIQQGRA